jgi:putative transposase
MPRRPRVEAPGAIQHVIARGNAGERIVRDNLDRRVLVGLLERAASRSGWGVHAYCLMDTHLHAVVETPEPTLGDGMRRLLGGYAHRFNRRHDRFGHLFAGPFSASLVETEAHAIEVCAYVVLNPVRAGLVPTARDWVWGSYRATAGLTALPSFLDTRLLPGMLHPDPRRARELYRRLIQEREERFRALVGSG